MDKLCLFSCDFAYLIQFVPTESYTQTNISPSAGMYIKDRKFQLHWLHLMSQGKLLFKNGLSGLEFKIISSYPNTESERNYLQGKLLSNISYIGGKMQLAISAVVLIR